MVKENEKFDQERKFDPHTLSICDQSPKETLGVFGIARSV